jgi:hypothetical protein
MISPAGLYTFDRPPDFISPPLLFMIGDAIIAAGDPKVVLKHLVVPGVIPEEAAAVVCLLKCNR